MQKNLLKHCLFTKMKNKKEYKVIRFSNREIDKEFDGVCWKIDQIIQEQLEKEEI